MSAPRQFAKTSRLTARVAAETRLVIARHALWSALPDTSHRPDNPAAATALPILHSALRDDLAMALCRLFETGQRDAATFPRILSIIDDPAVSDLLADRHAAQRASANHARVQAGEAVKRLRTFRDRVLAHNDMRAAAGPLAAADIGELVTIAAELAAELCRAIAGDEPALRIGDWRDAAQAFWNGALRDGKAP